MSILFKPLMHQFLSTFVFRGLPLLILLLFTLFKGLTAKSHTYCLNTCIPDSELIDGPVYIYYFYFDRRCEECIILENALRKLLNEHYSQELKSKRLIFKMINLTKPDSEAKEIIQELKVRRQLLLVVSEGVTVNMTRDAFRVAEKQYEHFRDEMKTKIDQVLSN